jgi:hypothetical protein
MVLFETGTETDAQLEMPQRIIAMMLAMWSALMSTWLGDGQFSGDRCAA